VLTNGEFRKYLNSHLEYKELLRLAGKLRIDMQAILNAAARSDQAMEVYGQARKQNYIKPTKLSLVNAITSPSIERQKVIDIMDIWARGLDVSIPSTAPGEPPSIPTTARKRQKTSTERKKTVLEQVQSLMDGDLIVFEEAKGKFPPTLNDKECENFNKNTVKALNPESFCLDGCSCVRGMGSPSLSSVTPVEYVIHFMLFIIDYSQRIIYLTRMKSC
jgi:hypothetical protein